MDSCFKMKELLIALNMVALFQIKPIKLSKINYLIWYKTLKMNRCLWNFRWKELFGFHWQKIYKTALWTRWTRLSAKKCLKMNQDLYNFENLIQLLFETVQIQYTITRIHTIPIFLISRNSVKCVSFWDTTIKHKPSLNFFLIAIIHI